MSNHRHPNVDDVAADQRRPPKKRRARWFVAGVAGLTGVAGLAAVSGPGALSGSGLLSAGERVLTGSSLRSGDDDAGQRRGGNDDKDGKDGKDDKGQDKGGDQWGSGRDARDVPCNADELIAAIVRANAGDGATLRLAKKCTYTLTRSAPPPPVPFGPVGLPIITERVTIDGNGATIVRAATATPFRILEVGAGGDLKLRDVTIRGGHDTSGLGGGGGGIRVDVGGQATIEDTSVLDNQTNGLGGGIANFGDTRIVGRGEHDAGKGRDGKDREKREYGESRISDNSSVFDGGGVHNNGNLSVKNTTISDNITVGTVIILPVGAGGGLSNANVATLDNVRVHHNSAGFRGGGIRNGINATMTARNIEVTENTTRSEGGGIFNDGILHLSHSKISRNDTGQRGGGIFNQIGRIVAEDSEISQNAASTGSSVENGGGVYIGSGVVVLRRVHVDRNKAVGTDSRAGGIFNNGTLTLTESKVTRNISALPPGGVFNEKGQVTVDDKTVIAENRPTNCTPSTPPVPNCFG